MELYIIRHAQSTNNALKNPRFRINDPALTALGHQQAELVAQHLADGVNLEMTVGISDEDTHVNRRRGYKLTRLYCSAMHRAMLTANHIGQATGLTPEIWLDIHEAGGIFDGYPDGGIFDGNPDRGNLVGQAGRSRAEILAEFPHFNLPPEITETGWWNKPHEDWAACLGRAIRVADELGRMARDANPAERVAMVSHGGFIDALLKALTNQVPGHQVFHHHFNTAITRLDIEKDGYLHVRYINRVPHLAGLPDLAT